MKRQLILLFAFIILAFIVNCNSIFKMRHYSVEGYNRMQTEKITMMQRDVCFKAEIYEKIKNSRKVNVIVDAGKIAGESVLRNHGLGQGGLSDETWMISDHISQLKNLNPKYIRLFLQEYYDVYPGNNVYNWKKLDSVIDSILKTGAKPLMCICFKPNVLYPVVDHTKVHPTNYDEWEELIYQMVRHYNIERNDGIIYWEISNEPDIGESGGCPYLFTPEDY